VAFFDPKLSALLSLILVFGHYSLLVLGIRIFVVIEEFFIIIFFILGFLVFNSAYGFGSSELKSTAGVNSVFELKITLQLALFIFATFVAIGINSLLIFGTEISTATTTTNISIVLLLIVTSFLVIYPLIQFKNLASQDEVSSLPVEFHLELILEDIAQKLKSKWLTAIIAYIIFYIIPIIFIREILGTPIITAMMLWAFILPMINVGALAGTGLGEDLLRLRLIRKSHFWRDLNRLGWPKLKFRDENGKFQYIPNVDVGGILLIIIAIQALITMTYFAIARFVASFTPVEETGVTVMGIAIIGLVVLNKGRGALKELIGVWKESGFKVSPIPLYLSVFVMLGVILASILELFLNMSASQQQISVLGIYGLNEYPQVLAFFLILNNIIFVSSAIFIFLRPPGSAEKRLVQEIPKFHQEADGWVHFYETIKSDDAVVAMLEIATKKAKNNSEQRDLIKRMVKETLTSDNEKVLVKASNSLNELCKVIEEEDEEIFFLLTDVIESKALGAQIFGLRATLAYSKVCSTDTLTKLIMLVQTKLYDPEISVKWEAVQTIRTIMEENREIQGYALSLIIRSLSFHDITTADATLQLMYRVSRDNNLIGQMALSTLVIELSNIESETILNANYDTIIAGIKSVIQARPNLGSELIETIKQHLQSTNHIQRRNSLKILQTMAEYVKGYEHVIQAMVLNSLTDKNEMVKTEAYKTLSNVHKMHEKEELTFSYIASEFDNINDELKILAIDCFEKIASSSEEIRLGIFNLTRPLTRNQNVVLVIRLIKLYANIAEHASEALVEEIYLHLQSLEKRSDEKLLLNLISAYGKFVSANPALANSIYRTVQKYPVEINMTMKMAILETMGMVGLHSNRFSEEVFDKIAPFTKDASWQIRSVAFGALVNSAKKNAAQRLKILPYLSEAFKDSDLHIKTDALDFAESLLDESSRIGDQLMEIAQKLLRSKNPGNRTTGLRLFRRVVERRASLIDETLKAISKSYTEESFHSRSSLIEILKITMERLSKLRQIPSNTNSLIRGNIDFILKAANNSDPRIRRTAYEALTIINQNLPLSNHAERGRNAINKALNKQEKDPALLEYLEQCRILSIPQTSKFDY
jgi:hypothetical protein